MGKVIALIIILVASLNFTCKAQQAVEKKEHALYLKQGPRKGNSPLTSSTTVGQGASGQPDPICTNYIDTSNLHMIGNGIAIICPNDPNSITLSGFPTGGQWTYNLDGNNNNIGFNDNIIQVTDPGVYTYSVTDKCGFSSENVNLTIILTRSIPLDSLPINNIICTSGSVLLYGPSSITNYQWMLDSVAINGAVSNTYTAATTGMYSVQTNLGGNGCIVNSDKINVTVYNSPSSLNLIGTDTLNNNLTVLASTSDIYPQNITWYRNNKIVKSINNTGKIVAGGHGAGSANNQLNQPYGIFVDSMKNIYVADYGNSRLVKWLPNGDNGTIISSGNDQINSVLVDSNSIYISYFNGVQDIFSGRVNSGSPFGLAFDKLHNIYFPTPYGINLFDSTNQYSKNVINEGFSIDPGDLSQIVAPSDIFVDSLNNYYIADNVMDSNDNYYGRIVKWTQGASSGILIAGGNGYGNSPNQIGYASGLTFDKSGNLYVSDAANNRVQLWKPGADHGITIASGFTPWGIKVDNDGNIYVADQTNNQVLEFSPLFNNSITIDSPGLYKAIINYPGGCSSQGTFLACLGGPKGTITKIDSTICSGSFTLLHATGGTSYQWYLNGVTLQGAVFDTLSATAGGTYSADIIGIEGCKNQASNNVVLSVIPMPDTTVNVSGPLTFCEGNSVQFSAAAGLTSYQWELNGNAIPGETGQTYSDNANGNITVRVSKDKCVNTSVPRAVVVKSNPPTPVLNSVSTTLCQGSSLSLTSSYQGTNQWYNLDTLINVSNTNVLIVDSAGNYSVFANMNGCLSPRSNYLSISIHPLPAQPIITHDTAGLHSSSNTGNQWYFNGSIITGATNNIYKPDKSGNYTVQVTEQGCVSPLSAPYNLVVTVINPPPLNSNEIKVWPNPVLNILHIEYPNNYIKVTASLIDISGREVRRNDGFIKNCDIDVNNLAGGFYILLLINNSTLEKNQIMIIKY